MSALRQYIIIFLRILADEQLPCVDYREVDMTLTYIANSIVNGDHIRTELGIVVIELGRVKQAQLEDHNALRLVKHHASDV